MIPREVTGRISGDAQPDAIWLGIRTATGEEWCERVRVANGTFSFQARLQGTYHAFIETEPLGKGRREIGSFDLPEEEAPELRCDRRLLQVRVVGEPNRTCGLYDFIGIANEFWSYTGAGIDKRPEVELDRTYEWKQAKFDRIVLFRECLEVVLWWPLVDEQTDTVVLQYSDAHEEPTPAQIKSLMEMNHRYMNELGEQTALTNPLPLQSRRRRTM